MKAVKKNSSRTGRTLSAKRAHPKVNGTRSARKSSATRDVKLKISGKLGPTRVAKRPPMPVDERHVAAVRNFETALQLEQRQNYRKARDIFEKLVSTGPADVADRARVHLRACTERIGIKTPAPRTAGDYHVLGVAELNARALDQAVEHLSKAQKLEPRREEIRYALAAAHSLRGDREAALEHLQAAISLRPQNRFQARQDADFHPLAADPRFLTLVNMHDGDGGYRSRL